MLVNIKVTGGLNIESGHIDPKATQGLKSSMFFPQAFLCVITVSSTADRGPGAPSGSLVAPERRHKETMLPTARLGDRAPARVYFAVASRSSLNSSAVIPFLSPLSCCTDAFHIKSLPAAQSYAITEVVFNSAQIKLN